jgi:hypothetical protein
VGGCNKIMVDVLTMLGYVICFKEKGIVNGG